MLRFLTKAGWTLTPAVVEVTSEEREYPVESALVAGGMRGWRAARFGTQTIRLIFDEPRRAHTHLRSSSKKTETERTQESVLRWSGVAVARFKKLCASSGISVRPIQRARSRNIEVELSGVTALELVIVPDTSRGAARASLKSLRLS